MQFTEGESDDPKIASSIGPEFLIDDFVYLFCQLSRATCSYERFKNVQEHQDDAQATAVPSDQEIADAKASSTMRHP